ISDAISRLHSPAEEDGDNRAALPSMRGPTVSARTPPTNAAIRAITASLLTSEATMSPATAPPTAPTRTMARTPAETEPPVGIDRISPPPGTDAAPYSCVSLGPGAEEVPIGC